ncbi:MAG: hypothetical protein KDD94_04250 [Calditrichaeota bacterium]|nr:hypothetical protein [Calditrichota bacterium]
MKSKFHFLKVFLMSSIFVFWVACDTVNSNEDGDNNMNDPDSLKTGTVRVLVLSNYLHDTVAAQFPQFIANAEFTAVDIDSDTPTVAFLDSFDLVILFEDGLVNYPTIIGDSIYQYVMNGGNLILGTFYWQDRSDGGHTTNGWGMLETIDPIYSGSCAYSDDHMDSVIAHPMTEGVDSLLAYYRGGVDSLRNGATALAWWSDGSILLAYNQPAGRITAVTVAPQHEFYVISQQRNLSGDFRQLWYNVIRWTGGFEL